MRSVFRSIRFSILPSLGKTKRSLCFSPIRDGTGDASTELQALCRVVSSPVGGLDDLEEMLNRVSVSVSSKLVTQVIDSCRNETSARRLLRFFSWSRRNPGSCLDDKEFNYVLRVLAEKRDHTAIQLLLSDIREEKLAMDRQTFGLVAESLVKLGREEEALGIFKSLDKFSCPQDSFTVTAIISALCSRGHVKKALGVLHHHKEIILGNELCVYRSLLYGLSIQKNVKEARKVIQEMKSAGIAPDIFCYNTLLSCLCERNVRRNPSGLVPEALNVMSEMRSYKISPTSISYNILLSSLGRVRRVKESCRILEQMKQSGCDPDSTSYYLVTRMLYLTGRFGKGNKVVDEMIERGLKPECKIYYDLIGILCGVKRVNLAIELFEKMKRNSVGGYGAVYDVLIQKLCKGGDFERGRELWNEAMSLGVTLRCSVDLLDPSVTEAFEPTKKKEVISMEDYDALKAKMQLKMSKTKPKCKSKKKQKPGR
ncbi:PREDICTED: pentatricopeptide repeat-containing protein At5g61370, mitochondrial [Tarenaya hassleriana]|uniref:pentatricopeptide repeat-containing protein At5g61370, mitochondrial n=1 Tax=Tarenaya hassleriana TaxID=28532 RepID=UPI00053C11B6|nr:PREDICTED: pentatricopeptide repeat-containing protein At5g61370, mitochondrial [Tarenaya hassleriana]XP_010523045.1 PREDICTED: pentatricopeptide repeat-containing protein At5g61370, mitochondrial [Tarenaya hassleriana]